MSAEFVARTFLDLTPTEFENFSYDVLSAAGARNLTWRTPGADGGRDIEGSIYTKDFSGISIEQLWYFECKRYSSSLDWALVYEKIAHADNHCADFILIITNSSPSPSCETQISIWNTNRRRPSIRVWRGYELNAIADRFSIIAAKYGLRVPPPPKVNEFLDLAVEISKITQAAYASITLDIDAKSAVECAAALSELFSLRCADMASFGRFMPADREITNEQYSWVIGSCGRFNFDTSTRAVVSSIRYVLGAKTLQAFDEGSALRLTPTAARLSLSRSAERFLSVVSSWADMELNYDKSGDILIKTRRSRS